MKWFSKNSILSISPSKNKCSKQYSLRTLFAEELELDLLQNALKNYWPSPSSLFQSMLKFWNVHWRALRVLALDSSTCSGWFRVHLQISFVPCRIVPAPSFPLCCKHSSNNAVTKLHHWWNWTAIRTKCALTAFSLAFLNNELLNYVKICLSNIVFHLCLCRSIKIKSTVRGKGGKELFLSTRQRKYVGLSTDYRI